MTTKSKEIYDYRTPWTPTEKQFIAYQNREVILAKLNTKYNHPSNTLHSKETIARLKST